MRGNPYAAAAYQQNNVQSLSPAEQIARLLETAAKHIMRAKGHAEADEFEARFNATEDAIKIIHGLQGCLSDDPSVGDMRKTLENYYLTVTVLISRLNVKNCPATADEVIGSLREMAGTWREIGRKVSGESAAAPPPAADPTTSQVQVNAV